MLTVIELGLAFVAGFTAFPLMLFLLAAMNHKWQGLPSR